MTLVELQRALRAADPGAVLVPARILDNVIQEACNLRGSVWFTPHRECFVVDRQTLFRQIEQAYLDLEPDEILPDTVILLARPMTEELSDLESKQVLLKYWRRLFHAAVHQALEHFPKTETPTLSDELVRERVEEIGRGGFAEISTILMQDRYLLPNSDDREIYVEFAAVYLETKLFAASALPAVFPGIHDHAQIDRMLARDVDAAALYRRTRVKGAPDPLNAVEAGAEEPESHEQYWTLVRSAQRANLANNLVRAAILRIRASRIAPAALGQRTRDQALGDMNRLMDRLGSALHLSSEDAREWAGDLPLLLDKADQGPRPAEARLLYDLQRICIDSERDLYALDLVEWLLSAGKRPIKRPLPSLRQVRVTQNLRVATRYLGVARLHDVDRQHFTALVETALARSENSVREQFGRVLMTALQDVGLTPRNPPEQVALSKMIAEWLDRIIKNGFLTFSDLRDTISRNQLKMPDIRDPRDIIRGDQLQGLDRRLASLLDGVYRPSDVYMRWLEQLTAVNFGTKVGRALTLWVTLPFGGAALLLQGLGVLFHTLFNPDRHPWGLGIYHLLVGPSRSVDTPWLASLLPWHFSLLGIIGIFFAALLHSQRLRQRCKNALVAAKQKLHRAFVEVPTELFRKASLQKVLRSWQFHFAKYVLKPMVILGTVWLILPNTIHIPGLSLALFLTTMLVINSRLGQAFTEACWQLIKSFARMLRAGLLVALYRFVMRVFKQIIDGVELIIYTIDDWLRYRKGDSPRSQVIRTALGVLWFPVSYLARFFMLVMIEPGFNPAKAPVSYLAAKVMLPFAPNLTTLTTRGLSPIFGHWLALAIAVPTIWLLPDVFGFLFWETKENWSLYRANRRKTLRSISVGPHGETVKALLMPGFHSGAVPKIFAKLRAAEQHAVWTRNWSAARVYRQELDEISQAIDRFVSRELLAILHQSAGWDGRQVSVGKVELTVKRIIIELIHLDYPTRAVRIEFELMETCLVAAVREPGWLDRLTPSQLHAFTVALASLYKLSGVDLVREHIQANLPTPGTSWDVTEDGLVLHPSDQSEPIIYSLRDSDQPALARRLVEDAAAGKPVVDPRRLVFARYPLNWYQWVANWETPTNGVALVSENGWYRELVLLPAPSAPEPVNMEIVPSKAGAA